MRRLVVIVAALGSFGLAAFAYWRRHRRIGTHFMNAVVDPFLVRRGISGASKAEIGTLEHFGRTSGTRHLTPVHPVPTATGFRVIVPLGLESQWARNVLAAGHCRLQFRDTVYELDEPSLLPASLVDDVPLLSRWFSRGAGFMYLRLHTFGQHPGALEEPVPAEAPAAAAVEAQIESPAEGEPVPVM